MKATIRNDAPTVKVRNVDTPKARSRFSTILTNAVDHIHVLTGSPIGLLLSLTYSADATHAHTVVYKSDDVPTVRIRNTD